MSTSNDGIQSNRVPILNANDFTMWKNRIRQYMLLTDFSMWEVIENGAKTVLVPGSAVTPIPANEQERKERQIEMKALSTLLMAIPNEYLHQFERFGDAKTLWEALERRFAGTKSTKRNQRAILKQQYENFKASKGETMTQTFDRFNKLIGELARTGVELEKDEINRKFLRSLGEEWTIYTIGYRQGEEIDTMEIEDLYNDLRIFEAEVESKKDNKGYTQNAAFVGEATHQDTGSLSTAAGSTNNSSNTQDLPSDAALEAFFSSHVHTQLINDDLEQVSPDDLEEMDIKWQMAMLTMRAKRFIQRTKRNFASRREDKAGFDKSKVKCYNCHEYGHFARECRSERKTDERRQNNNNRNQGSSGSTALVSQEGFGFDWSAQVEDAVQNQALMAIGSSKKKDDLPTEVLTSLCSQKCIKIVKEYRDHNALIVETMHKLEARRREYAVIIGDYEQKVKAYVSNEKKYDEELKHARWETDVARKEVKEVEERLAESKLETAQIKLTITKFENASKCVDKLLNNQIHDKLKNGIGYNNVPPPFNQNYIPPSKEITSNFKHEDINDLETKIDPIEKTFVKGSTSHMKSKNSETMSEEKKSKVKAKTDQSSKSEKVKSVKQKNVKKVVKKTESVKKQVFNNVKSKKQTLKDSNKVKMCNCNCCKAKVKRTLQPRGNQRNWNQLMTQKYGSNFVKVSRKCAVCGRNNHVTEYCYFNFFNKQSKFERNGKKKGNYVTTAGSSNRVNVACNTNKVNTARFKNIINTANGFHRVNTASSTNKINAACSKNLVAKSNCNKIVKPLISKVWRVKTSSNTSIDLNNFKASQTLKRFNYFDAEGRPKSTMAWVPKRN